MWPYSFLDENGNPDGYNVELIKLLLGQLNIPYQIRMAPRMTAFKDLKKGNSDLMIGLTAGFHDKYGYYSENSVTLFTQSILSPKSNPTKVHNFRDLAHHKVYVNDSSLCHHLMIDYGWENNAIPTRNIGETIKQMSTEENGELVWNTLSLKWMLRKFHIDNLEISPVDMPHGEYKFMSNDQYLIHQLDSILTLLNTTDKLLPLQNKWFYPERQEQSAPVWLWYATAAIAVLLFILVIYTLSYRIETRRINAEIKKRNRRLSLIMETSNVRVWTFDIETQQFTWRNEFGQAAYVYTREEFAHRYSPKDFESLENAIAQLSKQLRGKNGEEDEITLNIQAQDAREDGDTSMHDFIITLSVLRRDKKGVPTMLIGTKKDVTKRLAMEREANERTLRYWALFNTPILGIILYDKNGRLLNINQKACDMFGCNRDSIIAERPLFTHMFCINVNIAEADGFHATQMACFDKVPQELRKVQSMRRTDKLYNEYQLMTVNDENGCLLGLFAFCKDITYVANSMEEENVCEAELAKAREKRQEYIEAIDNFIRNGKTRIVSYSPQSHVFTILQTTKQLQHALTQTRLMTLVDSSMRIKAMHVLTNMDNRSEKPIDTEIQTTLRLRDGKTLWLYLHLLPQFDKDGTVSDYQGIILDVSEQKSIEQQLLQVKAKTQEVEDTKTTFISNMMEEIRNPLDRIIEKAGQLSADIDQGQEEEKREIVSNAEQLTYIINNVLYLSRLEAHMVEIVNRPTDFSAFFEEACRTGWEKDLHPGVNCVVENPYEKLIIDIDSGHLNTIISQLTRNAAQHTYSGVIHTRYDYIGRRLIISIDDTGEGIAQAQLEQLNDEFVSGRHTSSGMGLPICKELLRQMGGRLEVNSETGLGTTVWVMLPCQAQLVKRKKIA